LFIGTYQLVNQFHAYKKPISLVDKTEFLEKLGPSQNNTKFSQMAVKIISELRKCIYEKKKSREAPWLRREEFTIHT